MFILILVTYKGVEYKMKREDHIKITKMFFSGNGYNNVHDWIDELYKPYLDFAHWIERHNLEALKEKYKEGTEEYWV